MEREDDPLLRTLDANFYKALVEGSVVEVEHARQCLAFEWEIEIAEIMYRAVRLGGAPCTTLPWRWGFGWPKCEKIK